MTTAGRRAALALFLATLSGAAWAEGIEIPICDPCAPGEEGELVGEDLATNSDGWILPISSARDDDRVVARAPRSGDLCLSPVLYQGWLCDWQGFEHP